MTATYSRAADGQRLTLGRPCIHQRRASWVLLGYALATVNLRRWAGDVLQQAAAAEHKVRLATYNAKHALSLVDFPRCIGLRKLYLACQHGV